MPTPTSIITTIFTFVFTTVSGPTIIVISTTILAPPFIICFLISSPTAVSCYLPATTSSV